MLEHLVVYHDTEPHSAALNMALDEAILETATSPILRAYQWQRPAISFGYFGSFADVSMHQSRRDIVRRWTGGGVVPHGDDFTYSIVIPKDHPRFVRSSTEIYSLVHDAIRRALALNGIEAELASSAGPKISEHCFANPVRADLLVGGAKVAGAAHRRSRLGLLHQGSVQLPGLPAHFTDNLAKTLCDRPDSRTFSPDLIVRAEAIARAKYGTEDWLKRR